MAKEVNEELMETALKIRQSLLDNIQFLKYMLRSHAASVSSIRKVLNIHVNRKYEQ